MDHRKHVALRVANEIESSVLAGVLPATADKFARAVAQDLKARPGQALVIAGRRQPAEVHALCHWINAQLKAPVDLIEPVDPAPTGHGEALRALSDEIRAKDTSNNN